MNSLTRCCIYLLRLTPRIRFACVPSTGRETSTTCIKWCNTVRICGSWTCRGRHPCIMQLVGAACKQRKDCSKKCVVFCWFYPLTVAHLSKSRCALSVGDKNVQVLWWGHVQSDTSSPRCINRQHRHDPLFAQRPGMINTKWGKFYFCIFAVMYSMMPVVLTSLT